MPVDTVRERYPQAVEAVAAFFAQFYGGDVTQADDGEEEVVLFYVGKSRKIIAVSADFLADFSATEIRENLASWNVAHLSRTLERGCRLKITSEGPQEERGR